MTKTYQTYGTCAKFIDIEINHDKLTSVRFIGGCSGNTQGIAALVKGMSIDEIIDKLKGIVCRGGTSCPDQLARALEETRLSKAC